MAILDLDLAPVDQAREAMVKLRQWAMLTLI